MPPMRHFLLFYAFLLVLATLLPLFRSSAWWVRVFDFPRIQLAVLILVAFCLVVSLWEINTWSDYLLPGALALSGAYQGYWILPYMPWMRRQVVDSRTATPGACFSLMVANVLMTNRNTDALLGLVRRWEPDLVLAVETDARWAEGLDALEEQYPQVLKYPLDNTYGMLLYSRLSLQDAAVRFLIEPDVPSMFVTAVLDTGSTFDLICLHPRPPRPDIAQDSDRRDAELLLVGEELGSQTGPTVVAGDLNDVAWSHTTRLFQRLSGLLDPRRGRGLFSTFHARFPFWRYPLDHIFHSAHFRLVRLERLPGFGSDHFPIFAELSYEPGGRVEQDPPRGKPEDRVEADDRIEEGRG